MHFNLHLVEDFTFAERKTVKCTKNFINFVYINFTFNVNNCNVSKIFRKTIKFSGTVPKTKTLSCVYFTLHRKCNRYF